jgi:hypothetical protein
MKFVALLLLVNFFFDLGAWTLLLNSVLGQGLLDWGMPHSAFAVAGALLLSIAIFIYEQQFMTTDTSIKMSRWMTAVVLRLTVVIGAAIVTSQPVELMFFNGPISRRAHEESIRVEAIAKLKQLEDAQRMQTSAGLAETPEQQNLEGHKKKLDDAEVAFGVADKNLIAANGRLSSARTNLRQIRRRLNEDYRNYQARLQRASAAVSRAESDLATAQGEFNSKETQVTRLRAGLPALQTPVNDLIQREREKKERLENWIARVRTSNPGDVFEERPGDPSGWRYEDQSYDFFQKLRVLSDLSDGRPPRWPSEASDAHIEVLAKTFKFKGLSEAENAEDALNRQIDSRFYTRAYWAVFVIAMVIPTLMLGFKLLQPEEMRHYYSSARQAEAGNYGVVRFYLKPQGAISKS